MPTQPAANYSVNGRISDQQRASFPGLTVRVYSHDEASRDALLGEGTTDRDGRYSIRYTWAPTDSREQERTGPDIYIMVFSGGEQIGRSPLRTDVRQRISISLQVNFPAPTEPEQSVLSVSGVVRKSDGRPLGGVVVRAVHKRLRTEATLGRDSLADAAGRYFITYTEAELDQSSGTHVNLVVRAFNRANKLLVESPVFFQTAASQIVDLVVKTAEVTGSPYEKLRRQLDPLLDGARLDELRDEEIHFLARSSRVAATEIARAVMAQRAATTTALPAAAFYAYLTARQDKQRGALAHFWQRVTNDFSIRAVDADRFRFLARAGEMVNYEPVLIEALRALLEENSIFSVLDLALWDKDRWLMLLASAWIDERLTLPAWAPGQTREEQLDQAAVVIIRQAAQVFPSRTLSALMVSGRVTTPSKQPVAELAVQAFHHGVDEAIPVSARVLTTPSGDYRLIIDPEVLEQRVPDLKRLPLQLSLRVWLSDEAAPVGQSEILHGASLPLKVHISLDRDVGATEYETVANRISFALNGADLVQPSPGKLQWLAGATGLDLTVIQLYVNAIALAAETRIPAEAFYAFSHPAVDQPDQPKEDMTGHRLRRAVNLHLVSQPVLEHVSMLEEWTEQRRHAVRQTEIEDRVAELNEPTPPDQPSRPVDILRAAGLPPSATDIFIRALAEYPEDNAVTRQRRLAEAGVAVKERVTIGTALRLAELVGPNASLVGRLMEELPTPENPDADSTLGPVDMDYEMGRLAPLARRSAGRWLDELEEHYPEQSRAELAAQARAIQGRLEQIYPNEALLGRLDERIAASADADDEHTVDLPAIRRVLDAHPDINLRGKGLPFQHLDDVSTSVRAQLESLQRLARIAPFAEAIALLEMGYRSSREIAVASEADFVDKVLDVVREQSSRANAADEDLLQRKVKGVHQKAREHMADAIALTTMIRPALIAADPVAIHGGKPVVQHSDADLGNLFGALDACSVEPCESVFGQPAYLVDMLELLNVAATKGQPNPKTVLEERRPDIFHLELSCPNAQTPLPAIDLVIELLEDAVVSVQRDPAARIEAQAWKKPVPLLSASILRDAALTASDGRPRYRQTSWSAEELLAHPEHLNSAAYSRLASSAVNDAAVFPWTLPFSLPHEEADVYLEELQTSRADLLRRMGRAPITANRRLEQASAALGLNPVMHRILLQQTGASQPWRFWGFARTSAPTGWPAIAGADVKALLASTGLLYADLIELLATNYINPNRRVAIEPEPGEDACDLSKTRLTQVDAPFLDRLHRFARLWLHLGCTVRDLDRVIAINGNTGIDADLLIALSDARQVASRLTRPLAEILPFWGDLDTQASIDRSTGLFKRQPSQYERLLLDKSRLAAADREKLSLPLAANASPDTLASLAGTALGLGAADLALLRAPNTDWVIAQAAIDDSEPLALISAIYRWRTLAQATNLSIRDLLRLSELSGVDPFESPAATQEFLAIRETLQNLEYTVDDLDFDLRHVSTAERLRRFDEQGAGLLRRVRNALLKRARLQSGENALAGNDFVENDVGFALCQEVSQLSGLSIGAVKTILDSLEAGAEAAVSVIAQWLESDSWDFQDTASPARRVYLQLIKSARLYARLGINAQALQREGASLLEALQLPRPGDLPVAGEVRPLAVRQALFARWQQLAMLSTLQRRLADRRLSFWSVRELARANIAGPSSWHLVAAQLGHDGVEVEQLIGDNFLQLSQPAGEAAPAEWLRFLDAIALTARVGVAVGELNAWLNNALTLGTSAQMRLAAASRWAPDEWQTRAPQLRHRLRQKQRAALLAWVRHNHDSTTIDELHTHFLIDLEVDPEQFSTRIAQATASVQAFVQRALLGKERASEGRPVVLPDDFGQTWEWMKSYRSWSTARKVFLYPENFLTPEVRDDKTPFFTELEQQLSQHALNEETIEDAIGQYLQKLDGVARLEIMGSCVEDSKNEKILHIVARTRSIPHSYFHRTWYMTGGGFTPWVKLELDIDGDWAIPVIFQGRLTLYWVKHSKQVEGMADIVGLIPSRPFPLMPHYPMLQDQYTLSWSTRQRKGWTRKQIAERHIARPFNPLMPAEFSVRLDPDRMRIAGITPLPKLPVISPGDIKVQPLFGSSGKPPKPASIPPWAILSGIVEGFDWVWKKVNGVWVWTWEQVDDVGETLLPPAGNEDSDTGWELPTPANVLQQIDDNLPDPEDLLEALTTILKQMKGLVKQIATIGKDIADIPSEIWKKISATLHNLPDQVWQQLRSTLGGLADKAWELVPDDVKKILTFLREQIDGVIDFLTPLSAVPQRVTGQLIGAGMKFVADAGAFIKRLLNVLQVAGLNIILPPALVEGIEHFFSTIKANRPGWAGPELAFEFGYFDVGEGGARALRLTPPPGLDLGILAAAGSAAPAIGAFALPLMKSPIGMVLMPTLIALNETARLLYSMFPGYPAFHDMPVRSGILTTDLPVGSDWANSDDRIRAWPGSGYFLFPEKLSSLGKGSFCTVAVNLKNIAEEELESLGGNIAAQGNFLAPDTGIDPLLGSVHQLSNEIVNWLDDMADKADDLGALLNIGMRVVQPLPFGPYPGRMAKPLPIIISEDRHCRNFLLFQTAEHTGKGSYRTWQVMSLYHPLTSTLSYAFDRDGVAGLYDSGSNPSGTAWKFGEKPASQTVFLDTFMTISPSDSGDSVSPGPASMERLDLSQGGAYSIYNWELFFHVPLLIAGRLARQQNFADALAWYRRIFDPTVTQGDSPQRFWRFKQFHDDYAGEQPYQKLTAWLTGLAEGTDDSERADVVAAWRRDPFNPHRIARLRAGAYARAVVMRTVETLMNWGDARFREGTWESVNEATQLYLLAREILGPRPHLVPARHAQALTYRQLANDQGQSSIGIDPFGNALLNIEAALSPMAIMDEKEAATSSGNSRLSALSGVSMLYFGVPVNQHLLDFWDTIESRLLKIRSGLDFRGRARPVLPPGLSLADISMPGVQFSGQSSAQAQSGAVQVPPYRFQFMLQKAHEFVAEVKAFGAAVLTAAEKRDAEQLARLRNSHQVDILGAMRHIRELQIEAAESALKGITQAKEGAQIRYDYYSDKPFMTFTEEVKARLSDLAAVLKLLSSTVTFSASVAKVLDQVKFGAGGHGNTPHVTYEGKTSDVFEVNAKGFSLTSELVKMFADMAGQQAYYQNREKEYKHQAKLAENDLGQFAEQIAAAQTRLEIARRELENQDKQITNANDVADYMQEKFTNEELYEWMLEQATALHFQSYLLAVDVARKAECNFRYERLQPTADFVTFENWDDLSGALMAGDRLQHDLRQMEHVYLEQNTREHEITRHISLAQIDPVALVVLRQTGHCFVSLPEHLFDADHPGHYQRRVKSISLSFPSVVDPRASVNCLLSLEMSEIRISQELEPAYQRDRDNPDGSDPRFLDVQPGAANPGFVLSREMTAMVTSGAQDDMGLFEPNLRDERYLPFEGAGAISVWRLEVPKETNRFDLTSISDVVIHMRYTARDGGSELRNAAWQQTFGTMAPLRPDPDPALMGTALPQVRLFSARHDFPDAWQRFLHPANSQPVPVLDLDLVTERFPYRPDGTNLTLTSITVVFVTEQSVSAQGLRATIGVLSGEGEGGGGGDSNGTIPTSGVFTPSADIASLVACQYTLGDDSQPGQWQFVIVAPDVNETSPGILESGHPQGTVRLRTESLVDLLVFCNYDVNGS